MAGDGGMMSRFYGSNGGFAGFDAIKKISVVVTRFVLFHFAHLVRQIAIVPPFFIGGLESAATDPDPAACADPFCAAANVVMTTGDSHRDIAWVFQLDPVFGAGVPHRILWGELPLAFQFVRA